MLNQQLEQTSILPEGTGKVPKQVMVDLGHRGDQDNPGLEIIHQGKSRSLTQQQRQWLKRRQAVEPAIGHLKSNNRMDRCWLRGATGDALHAVLCAAGYNLRRLRRTMARLGLKALLLRTGFLARWDRFLACPRSAMSARIALPPFRRVSVGLDKFCRGDICTETEPRS